MSITATLASPLWRAKADQPGGRPLDLGRIVGADWDLLPAALRRRFETNHGPATYHGAMDLDRSAVGAVFAWLVKPLRAPLPTQREANVAVAVQVKAAASGVVWERHLGTHHVVRSVKSPGPGNTVLERTDGGLGMVLDVTVRNGALVFTSRAFFLSIGRWRLPIPTLLTPGLCEVEHRAIGARRFRFTLTIIHPFWGTTFRQTGIFHDMEESAS